MSVYASPIYRHYSGHRYYWQYICRHCSRVYRHYSGHRHCWQYIPTSSIQGIGITFVGNGFCRANRFHRLYRAVFFLFFFLTLFTFQLLDKAVVTGVVPSSPLLLPSIFIAHRVQQSPCSSIFHRVLLIITHALALSASQFVHKEKSQRICTSMHPAGLELTKLT